MGNAAGFLEREYRNNNKCNSVKRSTEIQHMEYKMSESYKNVLVSAIPSTLARHPPLVETEYNSNFAVIRPLVGHIHTLLSVPSRARYDKKKVHKRLLC